MLYHTVPPRASALTESMRDLGYSPETAVADIVDNSIAASATEVSILFDFESSYPHFCIIDNGFGMNSSELIDAMRHGSKHPRSERSINDLGRFGLGLKTASFSQCRKLTVVSRQNNKLDAATWDLDTVSEKDEWVLGILEPQEIDILPHIRDLSSTGTMILWEKLDRFCGGEAAGKDVMYEKIELVDRHLALVFHRFLSGEIKGKKLKISMNGHIISAFDPFCTTNKATQLLPEEIIRLEGHEVKIQPYILPHHSKLSPNEHDYYQTRSEFVSNQGVYIYRNNRLMAWGSWFGLVPKGESTKLARVRIDFSNALDEQWTIDIKKSRAYPPPKVKNKLRQILSRIVEQSTRIHTGRGRRILDSVPEPLWVRYAERGGVRYSLNKDHPVFVSYQETLEPDKQHLFQVILTVIEDSIPVEAIYADYSMTPKSFDDTILLDSEDILRRLGLLYDIFALEKQPDAEYFRTTVKNLKPFCDYPREIEQTIKDKFHD
jgi:hypothetical protein